MLIRMCSIIEDVIPINLYTVITDLVFLYNVQILHILNPRKEITISVLKLVFKLVTHFSN